MEKKGFFELVVDPGVQEVVNKIHRRILTHGEKFQAAFAAETLGLSPEEQLKVKGVLAQYGIIDKANDNDLDNEMLRNLGLPYEHSVVGPDKKPIAPGSRLTDIKNEIRQLRVDISDIQKWLKENKDAKLVRPNVYICYEDKLNGTEIRIKELETTMKLAKSAQYSPKHDPFNPVSVLEVKHANGLMLARIKTAQGLESVVEADSLLSTEEMPSIGLTPEDLYQKLETVIQTNPVLSAVKAVDLMGTVTVPDSIENLVNFIIGQKDGGDSLISKVVKNVGAGGMDFSTEEIDAALSSIAQFINNYRQEFGQYSDQILKVIDENKITKTSAINMVPENSLSLTLMEFEKIASKLAELKKIIPAEQATEVSADMDGLENVLKDVKLFISEDLPNRGFDERKAAAIVLRGVASDLFSAFHDVQKAPEESLTFVVANTVPKVLKLSKLMLRLLA
jgi:hypothetical protein